MSDLLAPFKWMTRDEMEKLYPVTAKWPKSSLAARTEAMQELLAATNFIDDMNFIGHDGKVITGADLRARDEECRIQRTFRWMYDHGQGD